MANQYKWNTETNLLRLKGLGTLETISIINWQKRWMSLVNLPSENRKKNLSRTSLLI